MRIEVAIPKDKSTKDKGNLLEDISAKLLRIQQYNVTQRIRMTSSEIDLLCRHQVTRKQIYVECKAHHEPLSSNVLKNILGEVNFRKHAEGWLISTGPLGSEAKGLQEEWEQRPPEEAQKLVIYTPERILKALIDSNIIHNAPQDKAEALIGERERLGEWTLLITPFCLFWTLICLESGVPTGVIAFSATTGQEIHDAELLRRLSTTDTRAC